MDRNRMLLLWVAGAAGSILLYSAYKGKSPTSVLSEYAGNSGTAVTSTKDATAGTTPTENATTHEVNYVSNGDGLTYKVPKAYDANPALYVPPVT